MFVLQDPFFWAFVGMSGLFAGAAVVGGTQLGRSALLGFVIVMICDVARIILVLPFCLQPRFDIGVWNWVVGGIILAVALVFAAPALSVKWWDGFLFIVLTEEESQERALGQPYSEYKQQVKGRIIPGLPI